MPRRSQSFDELLSAWEFSPGEVLVREGVGSDGREVLLLRIDMGLLLMETTGRPDGSRPGGFDTCFDQLVDESEQGPGFALDGPRCREIDREFYQFYHRRIAFLALKRYHEALRDADHTLALMDFSTRHAPSPEWAEAHEQYRPFVVFHRVQAAALVALEQSDARGALAAVQAGLDQLDRFDEATFGEEISELSEKLDEMIRTINEHYDVAPASPTSWPRRSPPSSTSAPPSSATASSNPATGAKKRHTHDLS